MSTASLFINSQPDFKPGLKQAAKAKKPINPTNQPFIMKTVCLYFEIHQNIHLKRYRFFDIGTDHYYYDDYENARSISETAERSYVPALEALIEMAKANPGYFKCAFSLSEDISYRFNDSSWSEYPLFADTYTSWIANLPEEEQVINIFMELCALGIFQPSTCLAPSASMPLKPMEATSSPISSE